MKFSIRDVIWLTAMVSLAVAWWLDRSALCRANLTLQQQRMEAATDFQAWLKYVHDKDVK